MVGKFLETSLKLNNLKLTRNSKFIISTGIKNVIIKYKGENIEERISRKHSKTEITNGLNGWDKNLDSNSYGQNNIIPIIIIITRENIPITKNIPQRPHIDKLDITNKLKSFSLQLSFPENIWNTIKFIIPKMA